MRIANNCAFCEHRRYALGRRIDPSRRACGRRAPAGSDRIGWDVSAAGRVALGVVVPSPGGAEPGSEAAGARLAMQAQAAEAAGADSLWVDDHLVQVEGANSPYPFSSDGRPTWPTAQPRWESLTTLAFIAAATERCTVGTAVLILPQRHVVELAKTTATLDVLSGGRLVLGCGIGWLAEEMEACGWRFDTRAKRAEEMLAALRACWEGRPEAIGGEHVRLPPGLVFEPTPVQRPGPPLLVGGMSDAALRRAANHGDGWLGFAPHEQLDVERLARQVATLRTTRERSARAGQPFRLSLLFDGWPADHRDLIPSLLELAALGLDELIVEPDWIEPRRCAEAIAGIRSTLDVARG
jgi:probable F420-dependent oxidoreductase